MIAYVKGIIEDITIDNVVIDVGGIGYNVRISADTASRLPGIGETVKIYTYTYVKEDAFVITLEINGKQLSSEELADKVEKLGVQGVSHIIFIIGGSIGLGKDVLNRSNFALSFSKMTIPHQLMRVILLEQIYRSYRIINGEPYHK